MVGDSSRAELRRSPMKGHNILTRLSMENFPSDSTTTGSGSLLLKSRNKSTASLTIVSLSLRAKTTNCKMNFKNRFKIGDLLCNLCENENQDQKHLLQCSVVKRKLKSSQVAKEKIEYENIYSDNMNKQKEITSIYLEIFNIKNKLETEENSRLAPSTMDMVLVRDDNLPCGIVHPSSGK